MKIYDLISDILNSLTWAIMIVVVALAIALAAGWIDIDTLLGWLFRAPAF